MLKRFYIPAMRTIASIEGDPPEAGAPGGDPPPAAPAPADPPAGDSTGRLFTQAEVDSIVGERLRRDRAARAPQPTPPAPTPAPAASTPAPQGDDVFARVQRQRAFDYVAAPLGLSLKQSDMLFERFEATAPSADISAWLPAEIEELHIQPAGATPAAPAPPAPAPAANPPPATANPNVAGSQPRRVDHLQSGQLIDFAELTQEEILSLGPKGIRTAHEKILEEARSRSGAPPLPAMLRRK